MERLLVHPPFADPTQPYVSLPALKGALRSRGLDARVLDLNLEAIHHLFSPRALEDLAFHVGLRFLRLNHSGSLDLHEQREYRALLDAREKIERVLAADPRPLDVFRSRELFYDAAHYALASRCVEALFDVLSADHYPYRFGFQQASHDILPWSIDLLERYVSRRHSPLETFYLETFRDGPGWEDLETGAPFVPLDEVDFVGISVVFPSQLAEALYLARRVRELNSRALVVLGGPTVHQLTLRVDEPVLSRLLGFVDAIGIGEGEETLAGLFPMLGRLTTDGCADDERTEILRSVPNLVFLDRGSGAIVRGPAHVVDLRDAPPPDYSDLDLDRYLAPSRTILYAPTRGCYWNRCSFCHYGLSESGTAKYREVPPDLAASQLAKLCQRHGVRNVYLSCDVLSPSYALRFARALIARGLKIRWSSDLKIEKVFTAEECATLYRSGLRAAAFGMESGSDRVLRVIDKGCDRATLTEVNRTFHEAGIATAWMTFTDHPGETVDEALETVQWIEAEEEAVDLFIVGEFGLEHGSAIARNPRRYGVETIYYAAGDELRLHALYRTTTGERTAEDRDRVNRAIRRASEGYALRPYPWAGAVSTHHTLLHIVEFGPRVFRVHFQRAGREVEGALGTPPTSHIAGLRERARFSKDAIERRERAFIDRYLAHALEPRAVTTATGEVRVLADLSEEHFEAAAREEDPLRAGKVG